MNSGRWSTWVNWNQSVEKTLADAQRAHAGDESIDAVRERERERSVLHVHVLGSGAASDVCWVLSHAELHHHFGSKTPGKKAIEAGAAAFIAKLGPRQSVAVTAYLHSMPVAVLFAGS